jgi:endonuclease-3
VSEQAVDEAERRRMSIVLRRLRRAYPDAGIALHFRTPWELLVATVLSAQCTDVRVNQVTPGLFARYPTPEAFAGAEQGELAQAVYPTGYHNQKARALRGAARIVVDEYDGRLPTRLDRLVKLPGVGRKTAAVVLGNAFNRAEGIAVDTHVGRIVRRLGFTEETDPVKVERVLLELVPRRSWTMFTHLLIAHGRAICQSRTPQCRACVLLSLCPEGQRRVTLDAPARSRDARRGSGGSTRP